jgi:hypothetical protein
MPEPKREPPLKPATVKQRLDEADAAIAATENIIREHRAAQLAAFRRIGIRCNGCGLTASLHRWTFRQERNYHYPDGPHAGYWDDYEFEYCHIACPSCGKWNSINCRPDMVPLLEIYNKYRNHFPLAKLFDPDIVVGPENGH